MMLMLSIVALGCAHESLSWQVEPVAAVDLPSAMVGVVAGSRDCRDVADDLVDALNSRPGIRVSSDAPTRLVVRNCSLDVRTDIEVELLSGSAYSEERRVTVTGNGRADLAVEQSGAQTALLTGTASSIDRSGWHNGDAPSLRMGMAMHSQLSAGLAQDLAQQLAPLPETVRRRLYTDPAPGTSRSLHNEAVQAERDGDLAKALTLARAAYAASPSPLAMSYIKELEARAASMGFALTSE